jgi:serine/threonine-protein kinase
VGALAGDTTRVQSAASTTALPAADGPPNGRDVEDERSRRRWLIPLLLGLLVLLGVLIFFLGRSLGWWDSTKTLTVPADVIGKPVNAATTELHALGFSNISTQTQNSSVPAGNVIATQPPPGTRMHSDKPLVLVVSSGPVQVLVPNVAGQTQAAATIVLHDAGFVVTSTTATSNTVPAGSVIGTNPTAGISRAKGSAVQLIVSSGKQQVQIPSLIGQAPSAAGQTLGQLGLVVGNQLSEASSTVPFGQVTRTDPPAGTQVAVGTSVTVFVSSGVPQVTVPDLTNDTQSQASAALQTLGLTGNFVTQPTSNQSQDGKVINQNPAPNANVNKGSAVTVVIGSFTATTTSSSSTTTPSTSTTTAPGH